MSKNIDKNVIIKTEGLCKSFTNGNITNHVLKNISLEIYEGDFTIIMGSSGSGKSTLLYSMSTMDQPTSGQVQIAGRNVAEYSENEAAELRSSTLSYIFQNINLLHDLTAFENIAYPGYQLQPHAIVNKRTGELLQKIGLYEERNKYPGELSGGQQQRVAIARAVITSPTILFADEPTGALNSAAGRQVLDLLSELNEQGQSIVMVTHDIKACVRGNRLLYLSDGHIGGELYMGKYDAEEQNVREQKVFHFLESNHW